MRELMKNADFIKIFLGRLITNAGDSLYAIAAMWLVHELGGSPFYTGLAGFLTMAPRTVQFLAGPFVDRWSLKGTMVWSQVIEFLVILIIPLAHYMHFLNVALVLILMPLLTIVEMFASPAETAAIPKILKKEELVKGNSLMSFAYQGVDLVFSGLAGILVALIGAVSLYLVDSFTFAAALLLFATLKLPSKEKAEAAEKKSVKQATADYVTELKEGFNFVFHSIIAKFFIGSVFVNFAFGAALAMAPAYADSRGGSTYYGLLMGALSGGFLIGAIFSNFVKRFPMGKMEILVGILVPGLWIASSFVHSNVLSILVFCSALIPLGATEVLFSAVLQQVVPERLLARTFTVIASISTSAMPLGSLLGGTLGDFFKPIVVFDGAAAGFVVISIVFFLVPELRGLPKADNIDGTYFRFPETESIPEKKAQSLS